MESFELLQENSESSHKRNVELLLKQFGNTYTPEEIQKIYDGVREKYEGKATVKKFLPVVILREAKEALSQAK